MNKERVFSCILILLLIGVFLRFEFLFDANRYVVFRLYYLIFILFIIIFSIFVGFNLSTYIYIILTIIVSLIFCLFWLDFFESALKDSIRTVLHFIFFMIPIVIFKEMNFTFSFDTRRLISFGIFFCLLISSIESFVRIFMPTSIILSKDSWNQNSIEQGLSSGLSADNFYVFKYGSFMFTDSNGLAVILVSLLSLCLIVRSRMLVTWTLLLILLCFSRSAYFGALLTLLIYMFLFCFQSSIKKIIAFIVFLIIIFLPINYFLLNHHFQISDGSLLTKFEIFSHLEKISNYTLEEQLFGFGIDKGNYVYSPGKDYYAHALIPLLLGHVGLVGIILYMSVLIYFFKLGGGKLVLLFFFPFFTMGFSLASPWEPAPFVFFLIASVYIHSINKEVLT